MVAPKLFPIGRGFLRDEDGAVTVDWVVLTAAVAVLAVLIIPILIPALNTSASNIRAEILAATVY